jgi:hypothetical protein
MKIKNEKSTMALPFDFSNENSPSDETGKTVFPCDSRCGTIKILPAQSRTTY